MTYRDDHDAALARADALEKELADARAEHERDEAKIARLEGELRSRPRPHTPHEKRAPTPDEPTRPPWALIGVLGGLLVVAGGIVAFVLLRRPSSRAVDDGWDVQLYLADAIADAQHQWSDAELMKITADYVDSRGRAQLTVQDARLSYWFRSPSRAQPPAPPARIGLPAQPRTTPCVLRERIKRQDSSLSSDTQTDSDPACGESLPGPLHCTIVQIWQRAIAKGAPPSALAAVTLRTESGKRVWRVQINDASHVHDFRATFDDDCP